ncbi:ATPase [Plectosphaerella cucumerina]|uniref:ATPase n=1 Tax=Plectosphaerella cucumerina TaxID=40658 RepID=A0A8K0TSI2_9PEZI|nr:ATPase [Plectosphaerella cucumerina]
MADRRRGLGEWVMDLILVAGTVAAGIYMTNRLVSGLGTALSDPEKEKKEQARMRAEQHLERLGKAKGKMRGGGTASEDTTDEDAMIARPALNEYESLIAMEMVAPHDIPVGFKDIGGLDDIIDEVRESVIYPLTMPHLYAHMGPLASAPSGVLLYGPPGCGKTMMAKAIARESGASFVNLHISTLTEKWYGDSNKMVRAVFSLARKMQPAIIFIDEIDAVLGTRRSDEHEASGMVKAEFMTLWDGLTSANAAGQPARIVVLGATNRIGDIDQAILRRMPKKFPVSLPGLDQRRRILELVLSGTKIDTSDFDLEYVAGLTAGMSGSDIKDICRDAAMAPLREIMREHRASGVDHLANVRPDDYRGVRTSDFFAKAVHH